MSGDLEAAGALATAGLVAGAIEGRAAHGAHGETCLNCDAPLSGPYCSQCGQAAHAHRTLLHLLEEALHGIIHFDTKAWRTLPMLVGRPGTLTRNYIYGKRARYISPLALFLFTIFLMFFVFAFVDANVFELNGAVSNDPREELREDVDSAREELREALAELAAARAARRNGEPGAQAEETAAQRVVEGAQAALSAVEQNLAQEESAAVRGADSAAAQTGEHVAPDQTWQDRLSEAARTGDITIGSPFPEFNRRVLHSLENPDLALYKVQNAAYKFSFLLVPVSLPFVWLLFLWCRGLTLYDHVVFTLNSLSFASVLFVFIALTHAAPWLQWAGGTAFMGIPVHMFFHVRGAYALNWFSALWRTGLLLIFASVALTVFVSAIILLGLGG
jgi:hypothetical protein